MLRMCLLTSVVLAASPALAFDTNKLGQGGSLPLSDLDALIGQSAPLKQEVTAALAAAKKKPGDVICSGNRFPNQWVNLGGLRAAPYTCDFSGKWLIIEAATRVTDKTGHAYDTITSAAMKKAVKVTETKSDLEMDDRRPIQGRKVTVMPSY